MTSTKTWSNIRNWVRNIEANAPQTVNKILIGNKRARTLRRMGTLLAGATGWSCLLCAAAGLSRVFPSRAFRFSA